MSEYFSFKQLLKLITNHAVMGAFLCVFGVVISPAIIAFKTGNIIYSTISSFLYFISIYKIAYEIAIHDKKSYSLQKSYPLKGALLGFGMFIASVLVYALYYIAWKYITVDGVLITPTAIINNLLFVIWSYPFNAFIGLSEGVMTWYGYVIVIFLPFIACFLGYLAGYHNFDIHEKIWDLIHEKPSTKENEK